MIKICYNNLVFLSLISEVYNDDLSGLEAEKVI